MLNHVSKCLTPLIILLCENVRPTAALRWLPAPSAVFSIISLTWRDICLIRADLDLIPPPVHFTSFTRCSSMIELHQRAVARARACVQLFRAGYRHSRSHYRWLAFVGGLFSLLVPRLSLLSPQLSVFSSPVTLTHTSVCSSLFAYAPLPLRDVELRLSSTLPHHCGLQPLALPLSFSRSLFAFVILFRWSLSIFLHYQRPRVSQLCPVKAAHPTWLSIHLRWG